MSARQKHVPSSSISGECIPPRFLKIRTFLDIFPLLPTYSQSEVPSTGGHIGPPPRVYFLFLRIYLSIPTTVGTYFPQGEVANSPDTNANHNIPPPGDTRIHPHKRTTLMIHINLLTRRRGGPMCPPGRDTYRIPPFQANAYHPDFWKLGPFRTSFLCYPRATNLKCPLRADT